MRRFLILLGLVFAIAFQIESDQPTTQRINTPLYNYSINDLMMNESLYNFWRDSIAPPPYIKPNVIVKFAPLGDRIAGMTTRIGDNTYLIQINRKFPLESAKRTMFHEYVHVMQFHRGMLQETPYGFVIWKGDFYTWAIPWQYRPWEIHAVKLTEELFCL